MIDELLGRAELKTRIEELEAELESQTAEVDQLEEQLEAAQRRRKEAVRERQQAQEQLNRLEDRIAQLEGDLERAQSDEQAVSFRHRVRLGHETMAAVLDRVQHVTAPPDRMLTAVIDDSVPEIVREELGEQAALLDRASPCVFVLSEHHLLRFAIAPPLPPEPSITWSERPAIEDSWVCPTGGFTLGLVRSDLFAMGHYEGSTRQSYTGFTSAVKGNHSKGGFSQARFERRRDEQITAHLEKVRDTITDQAVRPLYLVGEAGILDRLSDLDPAVSATVDATGDPESALADAFDQFWTSTVYVL